MAFSDPIFNLVEKYKYIGTYNRILSDFDSFTHKVEGFTTRNHKFSLEKGDMIHFKNGYDIDMISEILGFDSEGRAFLVWDCYWYSIDLNTRLVSKILPGELKGIQFII